MKCPKCEKEMEHGYLNAASDPIPSGCATINATWEVEKNSFGSSEDMIALPEDGYGSFVIEGMRCTGCRVLLLSY